MTSVPRPCAKHPCNELVRGGSYCPEHDRAYDRRRPSAAKRGYGAAWRRVRAAVLADDPFCYACGEPANEVDHIDGDSRNNRRENLRSACKPCHSRRTARDQGFARVSSRPPIAGTDPKSISSGYGFA